MCSALTDLYAYALAVDAERQRVADRLRRLEILALAPPSPSAPSLVAAAERAQLGRDHSAVIAQAGLLRATIARLRAVADPAGGYL
jgi:hypothetical protein